MRILFIILLILLNIFFCQEKLTIDVNEPIMYSSCKEFGDKVSLNLEKLEISQYEFILHLKFINDNYSVAKCPQFSLNEITGPDLVPLKIEKKGNRYIQCFVPRKTTELDFRGFVNFGNDIHYSLKEFDDYAKVRLDNKIQNKLKQIQLQKDSLKLVYPGGIFSEHKVKEGEDQRIVAIKYNMSKGSLIRLNYMKNGFVDIKAGEILFVFDNRNKKTIHPIHHVQTIHHVRNEETMSGIASKYYKSTAKIQAWNGLHSDKVKTGDFLLIWLYDSLQKVIKYESLEKGIKSRLSKHGLYLTDGEYKQYLKTRENVISILVKKEIYLNEIEIDEKMAAQWKHNHSISYSKPEEAIINPNDIPIIKSSKDLHAENSPTLMQILFLLAFLSAIIYAGKYFYLQYNNLGDNADPEKEWDENHKDKDMARILGLEGKVTIAQIKNAWRKKQKEYHPDKVANLGEKLKAVAEKESKEINEAYRYLIDKYSSKL